MRRLLRGVPDDKLPGIGQFFHVALWRELAAAGHCEDQHLVDEILQGMPIVGEIARSGRWPALPLPEEGPSVEDLLARAWEMREKVIRNSIGVPLAPGLEKI